MSATAIIITDAVLARITDAERAVLSSMKGSEVPMDILADMVSEETMSVLFPVVKSDDTNAGTPGCFETANNAQEGTTMKKKKFNPNPNRRFDVKASATTVVEYDEDFPQSRLWKLDPKLKAEQAIGFVQADDLEVYIEAVTKGDKALKGNVEVSKLSKAALVQLVTLLNQNIGAYRKKLEVEQNKSAMQQQPQKQQQQSEQLMELKAAFNDYLSNRQKSWLRTNNRYQNITFREIEVGRYQVFVNKGFTMNSQQVLAGVLKKMALMKDWACKVQKSGEGVNHVYINMKLS